MPSLTESLGGTPVVTPAGPPRLPSPGEAVAHTLLNCLLREVSGPERQTAFTEGRLLLRLPRRGVLLRVALRRTSLLGAHRFTGPVDEQTPGGGWRQVDWRRLAAYTQDELSLRSGVRNDEFLEQVTSSHRTLEAVLRVRRADDSAASPTVAPQALAPLAAAPTHNSHPSVPGAREHTTKPTATDERRHAAPNSHAAPADHRRDTGYGPGAADGGGRAESGASHAEDSAGRGATAAPVAAYIESEQSLLFGHRFHPTPKARTGDAASWLAYAPEAGASFPLRRLAVREHLVAEEGAEPGALDPLDRLGPREGETVPPGYRLLPAHPWQYEMLREHPALRAALDRHDVLDLGPGGRPFAATASVRTLYDGETFLKFSLNVRITNCLRKNASYELAGAVALTRVLDPVLADLADRFPGSAVLREPAYRSLALPGPGGTPDRELLEGFGVIVREGLSRRLLPGTTPLLAAAVADEYPTSPAQISRLLAGAGPRAALDWWSAYLKLLVPPVLAACFDHGVVLEPHLQNVLICVDGDGMPAQVLFRDLEGTKLVPEHHAETLAALPPDVAGPMTYDAQRGWDRVVYCLLVNHVAELLAAFADLHPHTEAALWAEVRLTLQAYADRYGCPPPLAALLAGVPLPAKANLLTRWGRKADREAGYVRLPSPLGADILRHSTGSTR
ncbi:IucA/IucC family protein [Streptomyces fructofermentans]|uniref:IucA/IucC family protein n=1 Tax=Streptomyces fructofermentans TaxID=152141 RepID=UPI00340AAB0C